MHHHNRLYIRIKIIFVVKLQTNAFMTLFHPSFQFISLLHIWTRLHVTTSHYLLFVTHKLSSVCKFFLFFLKKFRSKILKTCSLATTRIVPCSKYFNYTMNNYEKRKGFSCDVRQMPSKLCCDLRSEPFTTREGMISTFNFFSGSNSFFGSLQMASRL